MQLTSGLWSPMRGLARNRDQYYALLHNADLPRRNDLDGRGRLSQDLVGPFHRNPGDPAGPGGWWILLEPELHLGEDVLVPDWAGWRRDRMPVFPDTPAFSQAPDWVCEVISPSTGRIDRSGKMRIYAREGVSHLWLVEPRLETLEVYRLEGGRWIVVGTHAGDDAVRAEPFDAVELQLGRWWMPRSPAAQA